MPILAGHTEEVQYLTFSPDGTTLASGGRDKTIKLWNVADGKRNAYTHWSHSKRARPLLCS